MEGQKQIFLLLLFPQAFKNSAGRSGGKKVNVINSTYKHLPKVQGKGLMLWKGEYFGDIQRYSLGKGEFNTYCSAYLADPTVPIEMLFFSL